MLSLKYIYVELAPNYVILSFSLVPTQGEHTLVTSDTIIYVHANIHPTTTGRDV